LLQLIPIAQHNAEQQQQQQQQPPGQGRSQLPYLIYLQGGPGFAAPRVSVTSGWVKRALKEYRVLLLDQRGTGRSSPISTQTLGHLPPPQQFEYLQHFRADNIVRDCEAIRATLLGPDTKWTVLGQSFGGFCLLTYLSMAPEAIEAGLFTGGLPPVGRTPDEIYAGERQQRHSKFQGEKESGNP
jgi:pimeloyl-ACP methyl ester carboxylesterase